MKKKNVYIQEDKFYYICDDEPLESQEVIDGQGKYMIPGLIDIHMHIESSMTVPGEFPKQYCLMGSQQWLLRPT